MSVSLRDFKRDSHGARYADVLRDPIEGPALRAALRILNRRDVVERMRDAVDLYQRPPLAPAVRDIEAEADFRVACRQRHGLPSRRLKQAVGVACKLVMRQYGYVPAELPTGIPDQGRLAGFSSLFSTARKYRRK